MPRTTARSSSTTGSPSSTGPRDWPLRATDAVDAVCDLVTDKTARPLVSLSRIIVYGIVAATVGAVAAVASAVALVRLLDVYLFGAQVWASDAVIGTVFALGGLALWSKRRRPAASQAR